MRTHFSRLVVMLTIFVGCVFWAAPSARGFALRGPVMPWTNNVYWPIWDYHITDAMALGEEYRWNVPVVTYGFDQSFLDYFGQPGVDAVEQAIKIINDLPPAFEITLTNWPLSAVRYNYRAETLTYYDLKSITLPMLLENLGLTKPRENIRVLYPWLNPSLCNFVIFTDGLGGHIPESMLPSDVFVSNYGVERNYDPFTLQPSHFINEVLYSTLITTHSNCTLFDWSTEVVDPNSTSENEAVSDQLYATGRFYTGLTRDDVGGLVYLYNRTNVNVETLDDTFFPVPGETNDLVRTAPRPGIEKVTFTRHATNELGHFIAVTNQFLDCYFNNGTLSTQAVQRIVSQPDFLFSAKDFSLKIVYSSTGQLYAGIGLCAGTDASQWPNANTANGNPGGYGPGLIRPPIQITYQTTSKYLAAAGAVQNGGILLYNWANFDGTTNSPYVYPGNETNLTSLSLSLRVVTTNNPPTIQWSVLGRQDATYQIDSSTNLTDWTAETVITNTAGIFVFTHPVDQPRQYFRATLQQQ